MAETRPDIPTLSACWPTQVVAPCHHSEPSPDIIHESRHGSRIAGELLDRSEARRITLVESTADGRDIARFEVPRPTLRLLSHVLSLVARRQTVVFYPESSELTTKQAAEVLGVSRPFLIRVLEAGDIPFRKVGRHRRVLMKDVLAYKQTMQVKRRAALDKLVKDSEEMSGYDL